MIFLDTHSALLLFDETKKIPRGAWAFLNNSEVVLSPMARLELDLLHEIGRIRHEPTTVVDYLQRTLDLTIETEGWTRAAEIAQVLNWTRDPFDRLIAAHAMVWSAPLLTRDALIQQHYPLAFWESPPK
jgi:PIN domain nuclease of toxin-antitoxin system